MVDDTIEQCKVDYVEIKDYIKNNDLFSKDLDLDQTDNQRLAYEFVDKFRTFVTKLRDLMRIKQEGVNKFGMVEYKCENIKDLAKTLKNEMETLTENE